MTLARIVAEMRATAQHIEGCETIEDWADAIEQEMAKGPVAVVGAAYQLLWCDEFPTRRVSVGDKLYLHPPAQPASVPDAAALWSFLRSAMTYAVAIHENCKEKESDSKAYIAALDDAASKRANQLAAMLKGDGK